jgi:hypothetical protein
MAKAEGKAQLPMFRTPMESMASDDDGKGVKPGDVRSVTVERGGKGASVRVEKEPKKDKDGSSSYEPSKSDFFSDEDAAFEHAKTQFGAKSKDEGEDDKDDDDDDEDEE